MLHFLLVLHSYNNILSISCDGPCYRRLCRSRMLAMSSDKCWQSRQHWRSAVHRATLRQFQLVSGKTFVHVYVQWQCRHDKRGTWMHGGEYQHDASIPITGIISWSYWLFRNLHPILLIALTTYVSNEIRLCLRLGEYGFDAALAPTHPPTHPRTQHRTGDYRPIVGGEGWSNCCTLGCGTPVKLRFDFHRCFFI